ncbi:hypothetical protein DH2020_027880 [Rehmannia glutinosa]|uniref:Uncharacterized protein n=1 Tax=Rehmannia glutinosa TaxID=99300 RepID=A0ABR0VVR7_REHGL
MLHLRHCNSLPLQIPSSSSINKQKKLIFLGDNECLGLKKSRRNGSLNAVGKDSEFEFDPDKAREALRKLDEQLQSLSEKQVNPPKFRAMDLNQSNLREKEETSEKSGSFWAYAVSGLLVFTIFYNIIFLTVIKPSIDGPEPDQSASMFIEAQEVGPTQQLSRSTELPVGP